MACAESKERIKGLEIFTLSQVEASHLNQLAATLWGSLILHSDTLQVKQKHIFKTDKKPLENLECTAPLDRTFDTFYAVEPCALLLYSACGLGYSSWCCPCKHWKYYIFIEMFIFNDVRKLLLGHKNTALWTFRKRYVRVGSPAAWFFFPYMAVNCDKEVFRLPAHPTLITSSGPEAKG